MKKRSFPVAARSGGETWVTEVEGKLSSIIFNALGIFLGMRRMGLA
jgi:hypothetical protein